MIVFHSFLSIILIPALSEVSPSSPRCSRLRV